MLAEAHVVVLCDDRPGADASAEALCRRMPRNVVVVRVLTKADLKRQAAAPSGWVATSSVTGQGLDDLRQAIACKLQALAAERGEAVASTAARCAESLRQAALAVDRARELAVSGRDEELVAAELRLCLGELGQIAGVVYTDDILDRIFSRFCIGK
jgi:tRNA modification GTPase